MFTLLLESDNKPHATPHTEGELYKVVTTFGKTFELRYGYYGDKDRSNPLCDPVILYPDFTVTPLYTDDGAPFVTMMQDACPHYTGAGARTRDTACEECSHFRRGEEWFGICTCGANQRPAAVEEVVQNE